MPCRLLQTSDNPHLFRAEFNGRWTAEEFAEIVAQLHTHTAALHEPFYVLVDGTRSAGFPMRGDMLPSIRRLFKMNYGYVAIVQASYMSQKLTQIYLRMYGRGDVGFYKTIKQAEAALHAVFANSPSEPSEL